MQSPVSRTFKASLKRDSQNIQQLNYIVVKIRLTMQKKKTTKRPTTRIYIHGNTMKRYWERKKKRIYNEHVLCEIHRNASIRNEQDEREREKRECAAVLCYWLDACVLGNELTWLFHSIVFFFLSLCRLKTNRDLVVTIVEVTTHGICAKYVRYWLAISRDI